MKAPVPAVLTACVLLLFGCGGTGGGGANCADVGDVCWFNGAVGICPAIGDNECTSLCDGFFDAGGCETQDGTSCYPVYLGLFGCLGTGTVSAGGYCAKNNDCESGLACISNTCTHGCDANHPCADGSGICVDIEGYEWMVCVISPSFTVGGSIGRLSGTVVLQNNGGDNLAISAQTFSAFTFGTRLVYGSSYSVTVSSQPSGQTCTVSNGKGTITRNVTDIEVLCSTDTYSVGGNVSGLSGTVVLQNNGSDNLSISSNGSFTFNTELADGISYSVTVYSQPSGQTCTVTNGSGTISGSNVANVSVTCSTATSFSVGGSIIGLSGTVVLQLNGGNNLTISSSGSFTFASTLSNGTAYSVTVYTQPSGQTCSVANGSGTISGSKITNVTVTCQ